MRSGPERGGPRTGGRGAGTSGGGANGVGGGGAGAAGESGGPSKLRLAADCRLHALGAREWSLLLDRRPANEPELRQEVSAILEDVRTRGDDALREMARRFDGVEPDALEVPQGLWAEALEGLRPEVREALEASARHLEVFHRAQVPPPATVEPAPGIRLEWRAVPLGRAGVYAPGGRAAYPSSLLMGVVPARAAGVGEVVVCTPPGPDGLPAPAVLAAAQVAGADRVFVAGGAGAVAALALGTESVPRCDAVVGPGNRWVTEAKRQVAGRVVIDSPAGPSELLIVADGDADPERVALELVAQAEHDPDAAVVLVTPAEGLLADVRAALQRVLAGAPRREVVAAALEARGALLLTDDLSEALAFAREYAPEHLLLLTAEPRRVLDESGAAATAGTVFLGGASSVAFGDYVTGANHVLPTGGTARSFSGLSALHFLRTVTVQELTTRAASEWASPVAALATAEGLPGHAAAALARRDR